MIPTRAHASSRHRFHRIDLFSHDRRGFLYSPLLLEPVTTGAERSTDISLECSAASCLCGLFRGRSFSRMFC